MRTASTAEQVSALVCSFRHRRYRGPLLAREMQLSEVQVRGVARRCPAHPVLESPHETQTPSAGLAAERALPHSTPCAPGALTPPPSALGCVRPATAVPMGILAWAPSSGPASGVPAERNQPPWLPRGPRVAGSPPDAGSPVHTLSPALPWEPGTCAPCRRPGMSFKDVWLPRSPQLRPVRHWASVQSCVWHLPAETR